jgi:hypothetical protein
MSCSKQAVLGIVSRYVQHYVVSFMPTITANFSENQKAEFVVFLVSAVYNRIMDKKKSSLLAGFRTAQADLTGSEMVLFFGMDPMTPIIGAMGTPGTAGSWSYPWANTTKP